MYILLNLKYIHYGWKMISKAMFENCPFYNTHIIYCITDFQNSIIFKNMSRIRIVTRYKVSFTHYILK